MRLMGRGKRDTELCRWVGGYPQVSYPTRLQYCLTARVRNTAPRIPNLWFQICGNSASTLGDPSRKAGAVRSWFVTMEEVECVIIES